jgi:hypothetical protein
MCNTTITLLAQARVYKDRVDRGEPDVDEEVDADDHYDHDLFQYFNDLGMISAEEELPGPCYRVLNPLYCKIAAAAVGAHKKWLIMNLPILHPLHPDLDNQYVGTNAELPNRASTHRTNGHAEGKNMCFKRLWTPSPGKAVSLDVYLGKASYRDNGLMAEWLNKSWCVFQGWQVTPG